MARAGSNETFEIVDATRKEQALIIGLMGPPGGGKTFSGLRLATGIQRVRMGPIVVIDSDNERAGKYAEDFAFKHLIIRPPFRSARFRAAVLQANKLQPAAIMIDSMSDEHEGEGGVLDYKEEELDRFLGNDKDVWSKREAQSRRGWIRPKAERLAMIQTFVQLMPRTPIILCFRSREKTDQRKGENNKTEIVKLGWQPIAPAEIVSNCDVLCLLRPHADGVPTWQSGINEEDFVLKLPNYAKPIFQAPGPLSEAHGEALARWARGPETPVKTQPLRDKKPTATFAQRAEAAVQALHAAPTIAKLDKLFEATGPLRDELFGANENDLFESIKAAERDRRAALTPKGNTP